MSKLMDEGRTSATAVLHPAAYRQGPAQAGAVPRHDLGPCGGRGRHRAAVLLSAATPTFWPPTSNDWGLPPCKIEDFLISTTRGQLHHYQPALRLEDAPISLLKGKDSWPVTRSPCCSRGSILNSRWLFLRHQQSDVHFPLKAIYSFPQTIPWVNDPKSGNKMHVAWFVFERGYRGTVDPQADHLPQEHPRLGTNGKRKVFRNTIQQRKKSA